MYTFEEFCNNSSFDNDETNVWCTTPDTTKVFNVNYTFYTDFKETYPYELSNIIENSEHTYFWKLLILEALYEEYKLAFS